MFHRMGFESGVDLDALAANVPWIEDVLGHPVPGYLSKAGNFPGALRAS
jgi:hydroxymethylglutaryl-CoA lyase